jgi:hypothetical protein
MPSWTNSSTAPNPISLTGLFFMPEILENLSKGKKVLILLVNRVPNVLS